MKSAVSRLGEHSPEVLQIIESIVEAEKIVLSKLDKNKSYFKYDKIVTCPSLHIMIIV
jgi:hypothetical protein